MTCLRTRRLPLAVLVVAVIALIVSVVWVGTIVADRDDRYRGFIGPVANGSEPVADLEAARAAAGDFGDRWDLEVGEVMQFENNYYAVLLDDRGDPATEVLVDPTTGTTQLEWGPAMMWNTAFGMHRRGWGMHRFDDRDRECDLTSDEALARADEWLADNRAGDTSSDPLQFPGYYTVHTGTDGAIAGMLSVRCRTGAVWYHTWHGDFVAMSGH